jgi:syntaxin 16
VVLAPQYVEFKEAVRTEMSAIKQKMNELKSLHGRAALTTFDDSNSHEIEIDVVTQEITRLFRKCEARLQHFGTGKTKSETDEKVLTKVFLTMGSAVVLVTSFMLFQGHSVRRIGLCCRLSIMYKGRWQ